MEKPIIFQVAGEQLVGQLHYPASLPAPGVCFYHGFTGSKVEAHRLFVTAARAMAKAGLVVLRFDFRGSGDSAGEFCDMTLSREVEDAAAALRFLSEQEGVLPHKLGIMGLSMGGAVAALTASSHHELKAVALWSAVANLELLHLPDQKLPQTPEGNYDLGGNFVGPQFTEDLALHRPLEAIAEYGGPLLVVHGTNDNVVPFSDSEAFCAAHPGTHQHLPIEGSDHVYSAWAWQHQAVEATTAFFTRELNK